MTYMCEHGNCHETDCPVIVTDQTKQPTARKRFCTRAHAVAYLVRQIEVDSRGIDLKESAQLSAEGIVRLCSNLVGRNVT